MERTFVLAVLSLVAVSTVQSGPIAKYNKHPGISEQTHINLQECAWEYKVDVDALENIVDFEEQLKKPTNETCALICGLKKEWNIPDNATYGIISNLIQRVYDDGFKSPEFSREDVETKVKNCEGRNECEYIQCIGVAEPPISEMIGYVVEKLTEKIAEGIAKAISDAISS